MSSIPMQHFGAAWSFNLRPTFQALPLAVGRENASGPDRLTVAVADVATASPEALSAAGERFAAVGSISLWSFEGDRLPVRGLAEPIKVWVPAKEASKVGEIRFWREGQERWSSEGVAIVGRGEGEVQFATTHLTLFALIWQGFLNTLVCAQLGLLSLESLLGLAKGGWCLSSVALLFWGILLCLASMCLGACLMDACSSDPWSDEYFLLPLPAVKAEDGDPDEEEGPKQDALASRLLGWAGCLGCVYGGSVLRDALDDICSRWLACFGELRDVLEAIWEGMQFSGAPVEGLGGRADRLLTALLSGVATRQAGTSLGLSADVVSFVLEDEDLGELLVTAAASEELGLDCARSKRARAWLYLHQCVLERVDQHWQGFHGCRQLPRACWRLLLAAHPVASVFINCKLLPHSLRMLFLACDLLGALMIAALFFDGNGMALNRRARKECDSEDLEPWAYVGHLLAIALGSTLLASIPVTLLASLHSRAFKKVGSDASRAWRHQLHVWRLQDRILWGLGLLYCGGCAGFITLFLANVDPADLPTWGTSTLIQLLEEQVAIPAAVGLAIPCLATAALLLSARCQGTNAQQLLRERRVARDGAGNWRAVVHAI